MAELRYTDLIGEKEPDYNPDNMTLLSHNSRKVVYWNADSGDKIVVTGSNLRVHDGVLDQGTTNHWELTDKNGDAYLVISDFSLNAAKIDANTISELLATAEARIVAGKDLMIGSAFGDKLLGAGGSDRLLGNDGQDRLDGGKGLDSLDGGAGNDRMTGGSQSDEFVFSAGYGKDIITDFDAVGGGGKQDYISVGMEPIDIIKSGHDVILDFGGGDTLTLLDVRKADIDSSDFHILA